MKQCTIKTIPCQVKGVSLNPGIGLGYAILHQPLKTATLASRSVLETHDPKAELVRLNEALTSLTDEIQALISQHTAPPCEEGQIPSSPTMQEEFLGVLNVYLLLANDPSWKRQLREKVQEGASAVDAVDQTLQGIQKKLGEKGEKSLWQERISDFEDISSRLKRYLTDPEAMSVMDPGGDFPIVVVANHMGPAELLDYDRKRLTALVLLEQSDTSHVVIIARSLNIPIIGRAQGILSKINPGDLLLVDGNQGQVYIRPVRETICRLVGPVLEKTFDLPLETRAPLSAQTQDGISISLLLNAGFVEDVDHIKAVGAEGVGLYRTEITFMELPKLPNVTEQIKIYREIVKRAGRYPVVFRTLDVTGDKVLPYLEQIRTKNWPMGERAMRAFFDRPALLQHQLRALIRASGSRELTVMLPMVVEASEVQVAREMLNREIERERIRGKPVPEKIRLGAMIEVPSLVFQLSQLFSYVDFLSVGSNDLFQFFYATNREHPKLSDRYDVLSPSFLNLLKSIQEQCHLARVPLSICGEMAGKPLEALALIGLGYRSLSMSAAAVPVIKTLIRNLNYQQIIDYMSTVCIPFQNDIRQNLHHFARKHGVYNG